MSATPPVADEEIVSLLQANDTHAMSLVLDKFGDALFGVIIRMVGVRETAEDLLQDVMVKVWHKRRQYDQTKGRLFTWLINITRNTTIDFLRLKKNQQQRETVSLDSPVYSSTEEPSEEMTVRDVGLQRAVEQLEDQYKLMIELLYLRGYSQREAAELTGIPLGTIKSRSLRAIQQLRQLLGDDLISLLLAWTLLTYLTYAYGY